MVAVVVAASKREKYAIEGGVGGIGLDIDIGSLCECFLSARTWAGDRDGADRVAANDAELEFVLGEGVAVAVAAAVTM